ncbi:hypothetical protein LTR08_006863 [Meristemomyces frigidus]|nr:hypothetical protein LTR08_006863 [Meristemomyces frigidus]
MEAPLDLPDEQLFLEGPQLEGALAKLDINGWNTSGYGSMSRTTWCRVSFQHCQLREDILEIALGSDDQESIDVSYRAEQIRLKLQRLHSSYPAFMKIAPEVIHGSDVLGSGFGFAQTEKGARPVNALYVLEIQSGIDHTEFLLQRALINRGQATTKDLIPISRRTLRHILLAYAQRDLFRDFQGDIIYLLTVHGIPTAGVLAIELLKQEQSRQYTPEILPRSETIQDLSVLISALATVGPGEGNFSICDQGRRGLKRVLDQILSPHVPPVASSDQASFDEMSLYFPTGNDADFLQWLDNMDWDNGNWMNPAVSSGEAALDSGMSSSDAVTLQGASSTSGT